MWPHSITTGLADKAVSVGTDAPEVVSGLEPWRIPDVGAPTDYSLELHPAAPGAGRPRPLPGLYHGACTLLRSRNPDRLTAALRRVLGSHLRPAAEGQVRLALMPLVHDGVALLAPPASIGALPDRWLLEQGIAAFHTDTLSPGFAVAEVMQLVTDLTAANAASALHAVASLVEREPPAFAPRRVAAVKDGLVSALASAAR